MGSLRRLTRVALLAITCFLASCGSSQSRYQGYVDSGRHFLASGNLDKASVEFRNALQIEPHGAEALYLNGRVAEQRGNLREAVGYYQSALDVSPNDTRARAGLAKSFVLVGAPQRALDVIGPGLIDHPDDPDLLAARAAALHGIRDDVEARRDAERAVQAAPNNEDAIAVLAAILLKSGDAERAITLVHDAVGRIPGSIALRGVLASLYVTAGQESNAEEQMRQIIRLGPGELQPRAQLASRLVERHELDAAQQVLEQAVKDLPRKQEAQLALVAFLNTQRSQTQALQRLRDFSTADPDNDELRLALGTLQQKDGATAAADATFRQVIQHSGVHPAGLAARDCLAALELAANHVNAANRLIAEVLAVSPGDADALILRANLSLSHGDPADAIVDLRTVLRDQPRSVVLQRSLARAYVAKGQPALAEETLRAAVETLPESTALKIDLAQLLIQADRASQAVSLLEAAVQHTTDAADLREMLIQAYRANRDLAAAHRAAEDLKALRPEDATGYYLAGLIAQDQKRLDESARNLERAYQLRPTALEILTALTRSSLARGRPAEAVGRLRKVLSSKPDDAATLDLLGATYLESKEFSQAQEVLSHAVAVAPRSWPAWRDLARVKLAQNDTAGAIEAYRAGLGIAPTEPRLNTELAALFEKLGRTDEAIGIYSTWLKADPNSQPLVANNLAMLLVTYRTDAVSLDRARSLTQRFELSDDPSLLDTSGWVHYQRHEFPAAVALLERAADHSPDSKVIRAHLDLARNALAGATPATTATPVTVPDRKTPLPRPESGKLDNPPL
jgi:tetratricopeptide (TPR) repeat protein